MATPQISVIVPVYKAEAYLHRCVDSLLAQTFQDYEILLIDDGSPDDSGAICDAYAQQDERVRVFHKENGGVSSARNMGLKQARGKWIAFVDADDYVDEDYLWIDERYANADVIEKSFSTVNESVQRKEQCLFPDRILKKKEIFGYFVNKRNNALWNKLLSRRVIADMYFDTTVSIGEDFLFFLNLLPHIHKYAFSSRGEYFYIIHPNSAMQEVSQAPIKRIKVLWDNMDKVKKVTIGKELHGLQCGIIYGTYLWALNCYWAYLSFEEKKEVKRMFAEMKYRDLQLLSYSRKVCLLKRKLTLRFIGNE